MAGICVSDRARDLLLTLLAAQRRGLLAHDQFYDQRGTHAMVAARALLALAAAGDAGPLHEHIAAYANHSTALGSLLKAIAAVAEETEQAAQTARRLWPAVVAQVLELNRSGHKPFVDGYFGRAALAALVPGPTHEMSFLYREVATEPISWTDLLAWEEQIDAWIPVAAGESECVDSMLSAARSLSEEDQVMFGLPRVARLVEGDVESAARRSFLLTDWLISVRAAADAAGMLAPWQQLVDSLVVAGNSRLAPYSD